MTPEDRAASLANYFEWDVPSEQHSCVAAAIREAVEAEREACAKVAQKHIEYRPKKPESAEVHFGIACGLISLAIRARGDSSSQNSQVNSVKE